MAPGKDQHKFDNFQAHASKGTDGPGAPVDVDLEGEREKFSGGPVFDFCGTGVVGKEAALRAAAAELKASAERLAPGCATAPGYGLLQSELSLLMPELYRAYGEYVAAVLATGAEKPSCSRGCSHCCTHYVTSVEPYELLYLHGRIRSDARYPGRLFSLHRRATLFASLLDPTEGEEAEDRALYRYHLRGAACPFLSTGGECGVYNARPVSCRMFFSMSHPSLCRGKGVIDPANRNFLIELPEDIEADLARAGAAFSAYSLPESLFEGLLKVNELFGRFDSDGKA